MNNIAFSTIGQEEVRWIKRSFKEKEVLEALHSLHGDKVLGPYGISIAFFQSCWGVLREDLTCFITFMIPSFLRRV